MADDPASIRNNNPGAMWYGPVAQQFGAVGKQALPGGNNAATFDDPVNGAAAHFALLRKNYTGMPLSGAVSKWSGGNSSPAYTDFIGKKTGLAPDTVLTPELLAGPQGLALAKAQAHWEAGKAYPLSDEQWRSAQVKGLGGVADASSGPGTANAAPTATALPAPAPGGQAPEAAPASVGMLSGADLGGKSKGPDIGQLAQRALAMMPKAPEPMKLGGMAMAPAAGLSPQVIARLQQMMAGKG